MALCGTISRNLLADKCNPPIEGIEQTMYIYNREDIASYTLDATNSQIITGITMKTGKLGYMIQGLNSAIGGRWELVKQTYANRYDHIVGGVVFERGSAAKLELQGLANGNFVVVLENKHKSGDAAFEIFGKDIGLESRTITGNAADAETAGGYPFELGSPEANKEPHTPATLFLTSYAATRTMLEATITPVV